MSGKLVRPRKTCRSDEEGVLLRRPETGTGEGNINCELTEMMDDQDTPMSEDPEGDDIDCDAEPADWKVRVGCARNSPTQKETIGSRQAISSFW